MEDSQIIDKLIAEIKKSKKYSSIADEIIIEEIRNYLNKNPKIIRENKFKKSNLQEIKSVLHRLTGSYQTSKKSKREKYLDELKTNLKNLEIIDKILRTQKSTQERINDYKDLYRKIFNITGKPLTIIDLGCGINPISIPYMAIKDLKYYAYDIDKSDIDFLNKFFQIEKNQGLTGKAEILNVKNIKEIQNLPNADIIFMFKLIDLIDAKKKKISEQLIKILVNKSKCVIASFATKTLTGKKMFLPKRTGFELMLKRNNLDFKIIEIENEIFYCVI